jgi:ABC-type arginine/histidine transport system permease subunit
MRDCDAEWLSMPASGYILIIRGIPALLQVFLVYCGLARFEIVRNSFLWLVFRDPFFRVILVRDLNSAAYTAEIISGALRLIPKGLVEAAHSMGRPWLQNQFLVTLPLAQ